MSTRTRKERKRAGVAFTKPRKHKTTFGHGGLGLVSGAEILAGIVIRGRL